MSVPECFCNLIHYSGESKKYPITDWLNRFEHFWNSFNITSDEELVVELMYHLSDRALVWFSDIVVLSHTLRRLEQK